MPLEIDLYDMRDLWDGALKICTSTLMLGSTLASYS